MSKLWLILILALALPCCRKGENDPAISLLSRKSRLAGQWALKSGRATYNYQIDRPNAFIYNESYEFDGSEFTLNTNEWGPHVSYYGKYEFSLVILKDGVFNFSENLGGNTLAAKGRWSFLSGRGDAAAKEQVLFQVDEVSEGATFDGIFNRGATSFRYKIPELRSKNLHLSSWGKLFMDEDGYVSCGTDFYLEAKK